MNFQAYGVPDLPVGSSQHDIADGFGDRLYSILGAHRNAREWFVQHSFAPLELPFRGAAYNVDTGENHSGKSFSGVALYTWAGLVSEFGFPVTKPRLRRLWNAIGFRAVAETVVSRAARLKGR